MGGVTRGAAAQGPHTEFKSNILHLKKFIEQIFVLKIYNTNAVITCCSVGFTSGVITVPDTPGLRFRVKMRRYPVFLYYIGGCQLLVTRA